LKHRPCGGRRGLSRRGICGPAFGRARPCCRRSPRSGLLLGAA